MTQKVKAAAPLRDVIKAAENDDWEPSPTLENIPDDMHDIPTDEYYYMDAVEQTQVSDEGFGGMRQNWLNMAIEKFTSLDGEGFKEAYPLPIDEE